MIYYKELMITLNINSGFYNYNFAKYTQIY